MLFQPVHVRPRRAARSPEDTRLRAHRQVVLPTGQRSRRHLIESIRQFSAFESEHNILCLWK